MSANQNTVQREVWSSYKTASKKKKTTEAKLGTEF